MEAFPDIIYDRLLKVIVVGDSGVGKTALLKRYIEGSYTDTMSTFGIDLYTKYITVSKIKCKVHIWDTCGQERFDVIVKSFYHDSHGIMLVFDLYNRRTFKNITKWIDDIEEIIGKNKVKMILVGAKLDLKNTDAEEQVYYPTIVEFLNQRPMPYIEVSSKNNINIDQAFESVVRTAAIDGGLGTPKKVIDEQKKKIRELAEKKAADEEKCKKCTLI